MKKQTLLSFSIAAIAMVGVLFSINVSAGSIRCGGYILDDGNRDGISKLEVESRCGPPYSKYGSTWVYSLPNGTVTRIQFKDNGEVASINNEKI
jgi:hypothetical protein